MTQPTELSYKIIPMIFLIFIPSYIGICYFIYGYMVYTGHQFDFHSNYFLFLLLNSARWCFLAIIAYSLSPLILSFKYKRVRFEKIVFEFEFVKKMLFTAVPILIISLAYQFQVSPNLGAIIVATFASSLASAMGAIVRIATQLAKKEFRFNLAQGYCELVSMKEGDIDKLKYLSLSLESYNKYLLRKMNLGIKNINRFYSLFAYSDSKKKEEIMNSICESFGSDKLKLVTYLAALYQVPNTEDFFTKQSLFEKLKGVGVFLATAIPIVISVIEFLHLR